MLLLIQGITNYTMYYLCLVLVSVLRLLPYYYLRNFKLTIFKTKLDVFGSLNVWP